jgi:adenosylhomocysteine nucleosidase
MTRVAIIAAMPEELGPLVRGWQSGSRNGVDLWRLRSGGCDWTAACAGAGVQAATRAFAEVERDGAVDLVLSTGWAGALREDLVAGRAYRVSGVIDALTGERFPSAACSSECWLVTSSRVAGHGEKQRLAAAFGASLVDMEAAAVARLAGARGIPFSCVKGVSDGLSQPMPDFNGFYSADGQFQRGRFIRHALLRPWQWPALMRMGRNCRSAAQGIRESLLDILDDHSAVRRRDGPADPEVP